MLRLAALLGLWLLLLLMGLELRRRHRRSRVQVGEQFVEQAILKPRSPASQWWPRLWLELHDGSDFPGHHLDGVLSLAPLGRKVWEIRSTCTRIGRFTLGPVWVSSSDPFGIFHTSQKLSDGSTVVVYPRAVPLPRFGRLPGELPGGSLQGARVPFSTPNVASIREYRPGDAFNRIHWPTTARTSRLMVREFELDPTADVWIVLDLDADVHTGSGLKSTEEYAVSAV